MQGPVEKEKKRSPWRENIEAISVSIAVIVLFKYFVLEAYQIPTGSMQPTLMGWDDPAGGSVKDRVLVDKFSYHYRDPERWEIAVFKYPLDRSKTFIKRIVGMPGEVLEIRGGDLFHGKPGEDLEILRRPRPVQDAQLKSLDQRLWKGASGGWTVTAGGVSAPGPGKIVYPGTAGGVRDHYTDGYPGQLVSKVTHRGKGSGENSVGDLRLECRVTAEAACEELALEFREGGHSYTLSFPGPAAPDDARPSISVRISGSSAPEVFHADEPWKLAEGEAVRIGGQNLDDLVELEVDGEVLVEREIDPVYPLGETGVAFSSKGAGLEIEDLELCRDIFHLGGLLSRWEVPEDSYVALGDNTQDSSDSRFWTLDRFEIDGDGEEPRILRGNRRPGENPLQAIDDDGLVRIFFRDEVGERWTFDSDEVKQLTEEESPFVPREFVLGRAVLVVWPMKPGLGVWRFQWVR